MPTPPPDEPITKVTLNLYTRDLVDLKRWEANWSTFAREIVHEYCQRHRSKERAYVLRD